MDETDKLFGCIEAGGTKFVLGLVRGDRTIVSHTRIPTQAPEQTLPVACGWLKEQASLYGAPAAIGIASFGPVMLDRRASDWGHVLRTAKQGWTGADIAGPFARAFDCPVGFDTDVNGAALAESRWGAATGLDCSVYVTVGTGIGGGAVIDGRPLHGLGHPEMGHGSPPRHPDDLDFAGICPFHGACFEGLASGPAVIARWGANLSELGPDHVGHSIIAFYLAHLAVTLSAVLAPRRIVMGGGVMATTGMIDRVKREAATLGGSYFAESSEAVIVPPGLGSDAGLLGALALAADSAI